MGQYHTPERDYPSGFISLPTNVDTCQKADTYLPVLTNKKMYPDTEKYCT